MKGYGAGAVALASVSMALAGCGTIYVHDEGLKGSTGKAHEALAGAEPLKPFDDQLASLAQFAAREDHAVADYWTALRDRHLNGLLTLAPDRRGVLMQEFIDTRLGSLTGASASSLQAVVDDVNGAVRDRHAALSSLPSYERIAASQRRRYLAALEKERPAPAQAQAEAEEEPDLECKTLAATTSAEEQRLRASAVASEKLLGRLVSSCRHVESRKQRAEAVETRLSALNGEIGGAAKAAFAAHAETENKLSERAARLKAAVEAAKKHAEETGSLPQLAAFRAQIKGILKGAGPVTQLAGWEAAGEEIDALIRAEVCDAPEGAVEQATKDEAKCGEVEPTGTTGRAQAGWAMIKALAQLQDANAPDRRNVNWLAAAKAIIAAEKTDAQLRADEARGRSAAAGQRLAALLTEAAALDQSRRWLSPDSRGGSGQLPAVSECAAVNVRRQANLHCSFAAYADAWNSGRLPAQVLRFREPQIEREFAVRRSRAVAEKQYALALAGAATLKDYGEGGLKPETAAQLLLDLGTLGVVNLED